MLIESRLLSGDFLRACPANSLQYIHTGIWDRTVFDGESVEKPPIGDDFAVGRCKADAEASCLTLAWSAKMLYGDDRTLCPSLDRSAAIVLGTCGFKTTIVGRPAKSSFPASGSTLCRSRFCVTSLSERCKSRSWLPGFSSF